MNGAQTFWDDGRWALFCKQMPQEKWDREPAPLTPYVQRNETPAEREEDIMAAIRNIGR